jgi:hypothetical protein
VALDPFTAGLDLAKTVVNRVWPDKSEQERTELLAAVSMVQGQLEINKVEAGNGNVFVAGWRPFIGWVCGVACAWNWIGLPAAKFGLAVAGHPINLSPADLSEMWPLLLGMLGLSASRSWEKIKKVAR